METSREIGGCSVLFAGGIFAGTFLPVAGTAVYPISALLSALLAACLCAALRHRSEAPALPLAFTAFFLCGLLCGAGSALPGKAIPFPASGMIRSAGEGLGNRIRSLPFRNGTTGNLLCALLCGDRSGLGRETVFLFRKAGASHLLALSGLHIGILYLILSRILLVPCRSPSARAASGVAVVGAAAFYTVMTGASPSIVRAFLFILFHETATLLHRKADPLRILCAALTLQLAAAPMAIRSVSFQLSYGAMLGIALFFPGMARWYPEGSRYDPVRKIWESAALALSCQLTTAPLVWYYFRTFPPYFLVTNLAAIPLTTLLIASSLGTLVLSAAGICPAAAVRLTETLSDTLLSCLTVIASM